MTYLPTYTRSVSKCNVYVCIESSAACISQRGIRIRRGFEKAKAAVVYILSGDDHDIHFFRLTGFVFLLALALVLRCIEVGIHSVHYR